MLDKGEIWSALNWRWRAVYINGFKFIFSEYYIECVAERKTTQMISSHAVYKSQDQILLNGQAISPGYTSSLPSFLLQ